MISVQINQPEVSALIREQIRKLVHAVENEFVFWDSNELKKRTCMSWDTIQGTFFYDPRFPKHKVGGKWYYPAKEVREFLLQWLDGQPQR